MRRIPIEANIREAIGKGPNRRLRKEGNIPAILYGRDAEPVMLTLNEHDFLKATSKVGDDLAMFTLKIVGSENGEVLTLVRQVQRDPVTERFLHIDLMRVDLNRPIEVVVSLHSTGVPVGVQEGGILDQVVRHVTVRCLPDDVPSHIELDVSGLSINDAIHVSDLELGDKIEIMTSETEVIFHVLPPRKLEELLSSEGEEAEEAAGEEGEEEGAEEEEEG